MAKSDGRWITVNGIHVFLEDGQTPDEALRERQIAANKKQADEKNLKTIDGKVVDEAVHQLQVFKHAEFDLDNGIIKVPFSKGITEKDVMVEGIGIGWWLQQKGFKVDFETRDFEYTTHPKTSYKQLYKTPSRTAYLRNVLVATIRWNPENK